MNAEPKESKKSICSLRRKRIFKTVMWIFAAANQLKRAYLVVKYGLRRICEYIDYL